MQHTSIYLDSLLITESVANEDLSVLYFSQLPRLLLNPLRQRVHLDEFGSNYFRLQHFDCGCHVATSFNLYESALIPLFQARA